jgi:integrase
MDIVDRLREEAMTLHGIGSDEQIAAVLGHKSLRTVPIYTASVRQAERAKQAMEKRK